MTIAIGQKAEIEIHGLGVSGEGVGSYEGLTIFVEGALPQERVLIRFMDVRKSFARGQLLNVVKASSDRQVAPCPYYNRCGGCQLQHLNASGQLDAKRQMVQDAMQRIGHLDVEVLPTEPSPLSFGYRNKIQLPVVISSDGLALGLYARHSHKVIEIDHCLIHSSLGEEILKTLRQLLRQANIPPYIPHTREGELRHILLRTGTSSQEVLVVIVTYRRPHPNLYALAEELMSRSACVKGVVHCLNRQPGNTVLSTSYTPLAGTPYIHDQLCGLTFKISPASFFQVNPQQCEQLYRYALEQAQLHPQSIVLDGYCGVGTLALLAAQKAKEVIGIESVPMAIEDAHQNRKRNHIPNVRFLCGRVEELIASLQAVDVALFNPPRKGCDEVVIREIAKKEIKKIVYISCNPATLARDLYLFEQLGYRISRVRPFDMFPQTAHVECVATLDRA